MSENEINKTKEKNRYLDFFETNKKKLLVIVSFSIIFLISLFVYNEYEEKKIIRISEDFNKARIMVSQKKNDEAKILLVQIINEKSKFYSPLSLNIMIENNLEKNFNLNLLLFEKILSIKSLDKEQKNLIKIKKALFLLNEKKDKDFLAELESIYNSNSIWKKQATSILKKYYLQKGNTEQANKYLN